MSTWGKFSDDLGDMGDELEKMEDELDKMDQELGIDDSTVSTANTTETTDTCSVCKNKLKEPCGPCSRSVQAFFDCHHVTTSCGCLMHLHCCNKSIDGVCPKCGKKNMTISKHH